MGVRLHFVVEGQTEETFVNNSPGHIREERRR